jgi:hypothetical protein
MKKQKVEIRVKGINPDIEVILNIDAKDLLNAILKEMNIYDEESRFILTLAKDIKIKVIEVEEE